MLKGACQKAPFPLIPLARVRGSGVGVNVLLGQVPPQIVGIGHCLDGELVVIPGQLVGTVVFIGNGYGSPGYGGYVPVVVVGIGIGRVVAVLVGGQQRYDIFGISNEEVSREPFP